MKHILIVDDDKAARNSLASAFQNNDREVIAVATAGAALKVLGDWPFEYCFLDVQLPDMPGLAVMKSVSQLAPKTKIVMMTDSAVDGSTMQVILDHAFLFFVKPFDSVRVQRVLDALPAQQENVFQDFSVLERRVAADRRQFQRQEVEKMISFNAALPGQEQQVQFAALLNISDAGTLIRTTCRLEPGTRIRFRNSVNDAAGVVRWTKPDHRQNQCLAGVQFVTIGVG